MKISVREIPKQGLTLQQVLDPATIGLEAPELECCSPLNLSARIEKVGKNTVLAETTLQGELLVFCARCLEEIKKEYRKEFHFDYEVDIATQVIDLAEDLRQEIILSLPPKVLCSPNCKGLCLNCGANLNRETCKCRK